MSSALVEPPFAAGPVLLLILTQERSLYCVYGGSDGTRVRYLSDEENLDTRIGGKLIR